MQTCCVVVVDDEPGVRRAVWRSTKKVAYALGLHFEVHEAGTVEEAVGFASFKHAAWIIDQILPDGCGTELLARLSELKVIGPKLLNTSAPSIALAAEAACFGAPLSPKPLGKRRLRALLAARVIAQDGASHRIFDAQALSLHLCEMLALTPSEATVLRQCCEGVELVALPHVLGSSLGTVRTHRSAILRKARQHGLADESIDKLLLDGLRRLDRTS